MSRLQSASARAARGVRPRRGALALAVTTALVAAGLVVPAAAQAAVGSETESNDTIATANAITLGNTVNGTTYQQTRVHSSDPDFYSFDVPQSGQLFLGFAFPALVSTSDTYFLRVYNAAGDILYAFDVRGSDTGGTALKAQSAFVPAGRTYVEVRAWEDGPAGGKPYTLKPTVTAGTVETESNDEIAAADPLALGTTVSGSILSPKIYTNTSDQDFYAIDIPKPSRLTVDFRFPSGLGGGDAYTVRVYDSMGDARFVFDIAGGDSSGARVSGLATYMPAGRAYIEVSAFPSSVAWGKTYTLKASASPGSVETEPNDLMSTADPLPLGVTLAGSTLGPKIHSNTADDDWYAVPMPKKDRAIIDLRFPSGLGNGTAYSLDVLNASGDELYRFDLSGGDSSGSRVRATSMTLPAGTSYIRVRAFPGYVAWGKTYTLSVQRVLTATPIPTISGTVTVGKTLTAKAGTWAPAPVTLKYQWLRSGKAISGATTSTYKLVTADAGKKISVKVTGSRSTYRSVAKTSAVKSVPLLKLTKTPVPTISGTAKAGSTLTAKAGAWAPAPVTLKYQWLRSGKAISGATKSVYKLVSADHRKKISVKVTGSKTSYASVAKISAAKTVP